MNRWLASFPETEHKSKVELRCTSFNLVLEVRSNTNLDFKETNDPRLRVLFSICEALDGVLMSPMTLRDAHGRILCSINGDADEQPDARFPQVIAVVTIPNPPGTASDQQNSSQEDVTNEPPSAVQVARRTLAFAALTARALLEQHPANLNMLETWKNRPKNGGLIPHLINTIRRSHPNPMADLLIWIDEIGIGDDLEPDEWEILQRPLGRLDAQMAINSTWRLEGLVILSWALRRFKLHPHDQLTSFYPTWEHLGLLDTKRTKALLADPVLRSRDEHQAVRSRLFAVHWRLRNFSLRREVVDFADFAANRWFGPLDITSLPLVDGDLALNGVRLDNANPDSFSAAHSASLERHQAANWLCDGPRRCAETRADT
ncbi:DUF4272 domain-containing protein [Schlesneria paludicola]|uniref:DUF4272 domain-containing protein n=1 Tax=Schlesneria paludicola TaxID=360056 RepID=UPI0012FA76F7|nr:DUF4272 domain-containing protein [Schlesneria paludicola]